MGDHRTEQDQVLGRTEEETGVHSHDAEAIEGGQRDEGELASAGIACKSVELWGEHSEVSAPMPT